MQQVVKLLKWLLITGYPWDAFVLFSPNITIFAWSGWKLISDKKGLSCHKAGFVRLISPVIAARLCQTLWGHTHKLLSRGQAAQRAGYVCGRKGSKLYFSLSPAIRNISKLCCGGHLHTVQSVFPRASEQVVFNQGLQVLVCEILCFEGHMRSQGRRRRRVISVQTSGILHSLVTSDDVLVNTYRKANLY